MKTEWKDGILKGAVTILLLVSVFLAAGQAAVVVNEGMRWRRRDGAW